MKDYLSIDVENPLYKIDQLVYDTSTRRNGRVVSVRLDVCAFQNKEKPLHIRDASYTYRLQEIEHEGSALQSTVFVDVDENLIILSTPERTIETRIMPITSVESE